MKVSLNTIKGIVECYKCADDVTAIGVDKLVEKIGAQLGGVDEVVPIGDKYKEIVIVKVLKCEPHPNADKLKVCTIDNGKEQIQVVCGAPNVKEGMLAAWLPPGATVPETYDKAPFVLQARELRGVVSNGMLASPKELALGDSHAGLLEIDGEYKPGTDFAEAFNLKDDVVIDIENKMFTHRPDLFGFLGIARELAGIQQMPFKRPDWYVISLEFPAVEAKELPLKVVNELPEEVPRFTVITMGSVTVGPSPVWLQVELAKVGQKSINNIVDYTNWFMLETGQPLHAYDYDKVKALSENDATIMVRNPKPSEKIKLLNGKEIKPRAKAIMIATDKQLIGIGGVMGGADTEVDENTTSIILEAANFDMYSIRRTSMEHGLFTDAVTRFTKGQSPFQTLPVLAKIVDEIRKYAGGKVASGVIDDKHFDENLTQLRVTPEFIDTRLGLELSADQIAGLLRNVEFAVDVNDDLTVSVPFWRTDIELREDVVEEVGRLYGYDHLPLELPRRVIEPAVKDSLLDLKAQIRAKLSRAGANEVLTYSFVHGDLMDKVGQDKTKAFRVANALSPDLQYYRLSLIPSLLDKVHMNIKAGYDEFALFEIGKAHIHGETDPQDPAVPKEVNALGLVFAVNNKTAQHDYAGAAYYQAQKYLNNLLHSFGVRNYVKLETLAGADLYKNPWVEQLAVPFEPGRSAVLRDSQGLIWGVVGEFKAAVRRNLKLPAYSAGFEIDPLLLFKSQLNSYTPLPRFPKVTQDITLQIPSDLSYQEFYEFLASESDKLAPKNTLHSLRPIDIYQAESDLDHKNVTFRLSIASYERTLTDAEVNKLLDQIADAAKTSFHATRV